ncbi:MAG: terpene cyclase/mutase family protein [Kiritimatiellae bacterium]|jgi:squalene-hopene/tetraprenyl-beta-curcumene cyclase|nr:terpene cyclase/mutase family protein [Kiritimatiellia bacterium]
MKSFKYFIFSVLALCVISTQAAEKWQQDAEEAVASGVAWLSSVQKESGAWSDQRFPALTALSLWATTASKKGDPETVDSAVNFITSHVQPDGGIYKNIPGQKGGGLSNYNTAICMMALYATGRKDLEAIIQQARTFVASGQHTGDDLYKGGFGYDRDTNRAYTDLMNTHFSMEALRRTQSVEDSRPAAQKKADIKWDEALAFVEQLQNPKDAGKDQEGGFFYHPTDPKAGTVTNATGKVFLRSYGSMTYAGLLSMVYAQVPPNDPRVISALDWAGKHWTLEENPGMGMQGLYFFYNVISRAMAASGREILPGKNGDIQWRQELTKKIISLQNKDGSWVNNNGRFWENDPVLATSYAVLALEFAAGITK